ncbi:hypothetical protein [Piscinibacter koreensis]|uniref:Uncharacterized protein n=1 Tax=Piscinibacter koreensis TaxID=2742824 RepID=A0A7Y6NLQ0_9BURK|nr:hypothetical protein [Schlegelella koreensis]NUZ05500.1 hypothetical protein [Schlegelella koreensis]
MPIEIYHRVATGLPNQDLGVMVLQLNSGQVWGQAPNGGAIAAVKAYYGPLPPNQDGVEFETPLPPSYRVPMLGCLQMWSAQSGHAVLVPANPNFAMIPVRFTRVRYVGQLNLQGGVDLQL